LGNSQTGGGGIAILARLILASVPAVGAAWQPSFIEKTGRAPVVTSTTASGCGCWRWTDMTLLLSTSAHASIEVLYDRVSIQFHFAILRDASIMAAGNLCSCAYIHP